MYMNTFNTVTGHWGGDINYNHPDPVHHDFGRGIIIVNKLRL